MAMVLWECFMSCWSENVFRKHHMTFMGTSLELYMNYLCIIGDRHTEDISQMFWKYDVVYPSPGLGDMCAVVYTVKRR